MRRPSVGPGAGSETRAQRGDPRPARAQRAALWPVSDRATPADRRSPCVRVTIVRHTKLNRYPDAETFGRTWGGVGDPRPARRPAPSAEAGSETRAQRAP